MASAYDRKVRLGKDSSPNALFGLLIFSLSSLFYSLEKVDRPQSVPCFIFCFESGINIWKMSYILNVEDTNMY
jgi:hypothetical protein